MVRVPDKQKRHETSPRGGQAKRRLTPPQARRLPETRFLEKPRHGLFATGEPDRAKTPSARNREVRMGIHGSALIEPVPP